MASPPFKDFRKPDYLGAFGLLEEPPGILLVANRRILAGRPETTWDLPGGGVEPKETLEEALLREMREETSLDVRVGEMLFVAEGERIHGGVRTGVWRSFFFRIERAAGEIDISKEQDIVDYRFVPRAEIVPLLTAPYHRGFVAWLLSGGELRHAFDRWID
ncbi:MAG TPA: NUDIX hydrolase [Planctomycetota bacterium]|nr:NUDIX hydrolase [Planctomycetota bacterium]